MLLLIGGTKSPAYTSVSVPLALGGGPGGYSTALLERVTPRVESLRLKRRDIRYMEHPSHAVLEVKVMSLVSHNISLK